MNTLKERPHLRFILSVFVGGILIYAYHRANEMITDPVLAETFHTGMRCNSMLRLVPLSKIAQKGIAEEDDCYLQSFQDLSSRVSPAERTAYLIQSLDAFRTANRLPGSVLISLAEMMVVNRQAEMNAAQFAEDEIKIKTQMVDDILRIADAGVDSRKSMIEILALVHQPILELNQNTENQEPASVAASTSDVTERISFLAKRYLQLKDLWIIHDEEIDASVSARLERET